MQLGRDDDHVVVEVVDNGAGSARATSRSRTAQGLGLSIVQALVTGELGGSIEMRSDGGTAGPRPRPGRDAAESSL